jgi:hypothetical protein
VNPDLPPSVTAAADQIHAVESESLARLLTAYTALVGLHGREVGHIRFLNYLQGSDGWTSDALVAALAASMYLFHRIGGIPR